MPTHTNFQIRLANDTDGLHLSPLIADVFKDYENCLYDEAEFPEHKAIASHYHKADGEVWIAEATDSKEILGCFAIIAHRDAGIGELHKVYVKSTARGSGMAQTLYNAGLKWNRDQGLTQLRLWTDTRFASGHRFYEKLGFVRVPVTRFLADISDSWEYLYVNDAPHPV